MAIVTGFSMSPKMLAGLRSFMESVYGKQISLVISCLTRWGTHVAKLDSVSRIQLAFQRFMDSLKVEDSTETMEKIRYLAWDRTFWNKLQFTIELLRPINEAIRMSESDRSTAGHVVSRWKRIYRQMISKLREAAQLYPDIATCEQQIFESRFKKQVTVIYLVAHLLNPQMINSDIPFYSEAEWRGILHQFQ